MGDNKAEIIYGAQPDRKIWFIDRTSGKVGSEMAMINRRRGQNGKDLLEITFERTKAEAKHKIDIYFMEDEWLDDIKKM